VIPIDLYNTGGVELTRAEPRGLFGLGNASGTVNVITTKANTTREIPPSPARHSYGGYRSSVDLNRPLSRTSCRASGRSLPEHRLRAQPSKDETRRQEGPSTTTRPFHDPPREFAAT